MMEGKTITIIREDGLTNRAIEIKFTTLHPTGSQSNIINATENEAKDLHAQLGKVLGVDVEIVCPYCNDRGFDLIGLKYHLRNHCAAYQDIVAI